MPRITLRISNPNNVQYEKIILRKFFNMVFFSEDGKKLTVYTATVFGGMQNTQDVQDGKLIPKYCDKVKCTLQFQYEMDDKQASVTFQDLTESFWKQIDYVEKVWGKCKKLTKQAEVDEQLKKLYSDITTQISMSDNKTVFYVAEQGKPVSHEFIATYGKFAIDHDKYSYTLQSDSEVHDGLEYTNWIKSEIILPQSIFNKCFEFEIILEHNTKGVYYTPDFTWYFAPPEGYRVDKETAEVDIGDERGIRNYVQTLAEGTTIYFQEWENIELIAERKKARVDLKEYTAGLESHRLSDKGNIKTKLTITNPNQGANKQFFIGLIIAFLLSFCADKTRMNDFYSCLKQTCNCLETGGVCYCENFCNIFSLFFPISVLTAYVSLMFRLKICVPVTRGRKYYWFYVCKISGIALAIFFVIYVFGLWMVLGSGIMRKMIKTCTANWVIIIILAVTSVLLNMIYIIYCTKVRKKKFFDNL